MQAPCCPQSRPSCSAPARSKLSTTATSGTRPSLGVEQLGAGVQAHGLTQGPHLQAGKQTGQRTALSGEKVLRQQWLGGVRPATAALFQSRQQAALLRAERQPASSSGRKQPNSLTQPAPLPALACALAVVVSAMKAEGILPSSRRPATAGEAQGEGEIVKGQGGRLESRGESAGVPTCQQAAAASAARAVRALRLRAFWRSQPPAAGP